ncbi:hypothetical protein PN450_02525 [Dolichospermum lemmermannii CS-548]|uniref:hypothetical protein n=1 Tax=Dolichospermum lemmermannii TaxID=54295 RepID=UPI00232CDF9E|nr:hypothetical protein [Dolichospermum lemmermannii]MDB9435703.1 hypothetical protein [Dolichospermum lemmermannii CS-548]
MYIEASEAWCFAEELSNKIINGVWSDVVKKFKQLNPMQSIYPTFRTPNCHRSKKPLK